MITYNENTKIFKLDTPNTSYVIGLADDKYLGHIYYGPRLHSDHVKYLLRIDEPPFVPTENMREKVSFLDSFPMEYSFGGTGDFRESCIEIENDYGQDGLDLTYVSHRIFDGKPSLSGLPATFGTNSQTLEIVLEDIPTKLKVILNYSVFDDSDSILRSLRIHNSSSKPIYMKRVLSACLDMESEDFEIISLHGSWARERHIQRQLLGYGSYVTESIRGESSHQDHPFLAAVTPNCTQTTGEVYAMHFIYSGNFLAKAQKNQYDMMRMVLGIHPEHFRWKLGPGQEFQAPEAVLVYSSNGLGKMTRTFHDLYRNHLIRSNYKEKERPVLINNWEATYFDFNTEKLISIAKRASKLGIEMLVMDDGWFGHRNSDNSSLGDWIVNEDKISGGLPHLVEEVNKLGMKFGIWFEPEMISPNSNLYKQHPEWALALNERSASLCREQYVLDLSRPEVCDYIYQRLYTILKSANIEYVKWDMNRPLTDIGSSYLPKDQQGELSHRHTLAVYALQERLIHDFPELLLENCSGGGARFDPGMLYYSPQIWCSDDTDAIERLQIQEGTQLLYPLSTIGAHVSDCPNHATGRITPFSFRGIVALAGTFGYELDITKISEDEQNQIPEQIKAYKKYSRLLRDGDYYRIASYRENHFYDCYEIVSKDQTFAIIAFVQVLNEPNKRSRRVRLQGLNSNYTYELKGTVFSGEILMSAGLLLKRPWGDFQAEIIELHKV